MQTRRLSISESSIALAAQILRRGELVALPTETVYGLAADATREDAVLRIYSAKGRPAQNPLIVHVNEQCNSFDALAQHGYIDAARCSPARRRASQRLIEAFWPGPLTLVLPRGPCLTDGVTAGGDTVGLRMPQHPAFQAVLNQLDFPLAAPSANRSNRISPTSADAVTQELDGQLPLILDAGGCPVGVESTVVLLADDGSMRLLRPGGIPREAIEQVLGGAELGCAKALDELHSPGMGSLHYAPERPLLLASATGPWLELWPQELAYPESIAALLFSCRTAPEPWLRGYSDAQVQIYCLHDTGSGQIAAAQLYATLRDIDRSGVGAIVVERPLSSSGLWPAITDRLSRASRKLQTAASA